MHAKRLPRLVVTALIRLYQNCLSPSMLHSCRFNPSCSVYALEAFDQHGLFRGGWMVMTRLLRCRPFGRYGYDPVRPA